MAEEKDTMQVSIYHIDPDLFPELNNEEIVNQIVEEHNNNLPKKTKPFIEQPLKDGVNLHGFNLRVFYSEKTRNPKWKGFLKPILEPKAILLNGENRDISFVAFVYDDTEMFAITGGQGNFLIQNYINANFGIDIITRLISENSKVIKSLNERGLTGALLASTKYYRFDYKLSDEDDFGKLYKQVKAELDVNLLSNKLGLSTEELKKNVGCVAKSTFKLNKSININSLLHVVKKLSVLINEKPKFTLNKVKLLSRRDNKTKQIIKELEYKLAELLFQKYKDNDTAIDLDICHPEYEKFLSADSYNLFVRYSKNPIFEEPIDRIIDISFLYDAIEEKQITINTVDEMKNFLQKVRLKSFNDENELLTDAPLIKHLHGEIYYDKKVYFLIDGEWYQIEKDFLESLDNELRNIVLEADNTLLYEKWELEKDENYYNQKYLNKPNFLVLDKVLANRIELCDILNSDGKTTHLIHVKKGFNNTIRDLTSQIDIAARALKEAHTSNDYDFVEQLYQSLTEKKKAETSYFKKVGSQADRISKEEFMNMLMDCDIIFCLAFLDTAEKERDIIESAKFQSNIAKYSIVELYKKLKMQDIPLKIIQVKRQQ